MNITILSIDIKTVPTAKGSYQTADVAYKNNTFQGKVEGKKIMSFGATAKAFKTLAEAQPGSSFDIEIVKNDKGYNDWVNMTVANAGAAAPAKAPSAANAAPRSNYETPEERAQRQIYIIRQSSISAAVSALSVGSKAPLKADEVISYATTLVDYVLGNDKKDAGPSGFDDFPDIPDL